MKEQGNPMTSAACRVTRSKDSNLFKGRAGQGRTGKGQGRVGKGREDKARQGKKNYVSKACGRKSKISEFCYPFLQRNINSVLTSVSCSSFSSLPHSTFALPIMTVSDSVCRFSRFRLLSLPARFPRAG